MRRPVNVIVIVFRAGPEYAVFQRADDGHGQSVSGGVEQGEDLVAAARRESAEESGLPVSMAPLYRLDMVSGVEKACFAAAAHWPDDLYIVPKHYFALDITGLGEIVLSDEHRAVRWMAYGDARTALRYDDDRTALWELDQRLRRSRLPRALGGSGSVAAAEAVQQARDADGVQE
ncbi:NUDIX hydrolase [Nonomuraea fuscirosea]|uniref:NUDIX hydrolase n=1 Tax=Nonomuraea fuscirosea TaxID=1291556 RepID=UPI0033EA939A